MCWEGRKRGQCKPTHDSTYVPLPSTAACSLRLFDACFPREHQTALKEGLAGGVLQLVGTDHAVFNSTQKLVGRDDFRLIPNGVNGIEVHAAVTALHCASMWSYPQPDKRRQVASALVVMTS